MRDKFFVSRVPERAYELVADEIRCNKLKVGRVEGPLIVTGKDGTEAVRMGVVPNGGGRLEICNSDGKTVVAAAVGPSGRSGVIETLDADGTPQVQLLSTPSGGAVTTLRHDKKLWVVMGHTGPNFGLFAGVPKLGQPFPITPLWRVEMKPSPETTAKKTPNETPREGAKVQSEEGSGKAAGQRQE